MLPTIEADRASDPVAAYDHVLAATRKPTSWRPAVQRLRIFKKKKTFITSRKVDLEGDSERLGSVRPIKSSLRLWFAIGSSSCGFICQFLGLRGLHGSVALYQLGVTLCMAIVRALLRSGRLGACQNKLKQRRDIEGHELDWQAMNLEKPKQKFEGQCASIALPLLSR